MANKLRELAPGLRQTGIDVAFHKGHSRTIEIRRVGATASTLSLVRADDAVEDPGALEERCA
jgi:hypothetical protein